MQPPRTVQAQDAGGIGFPMNSHRRDAHGVVSGTHDAAAPIRPDGTHAYTGALSLSLSLIFSAESYVRRVITI